MADNNKSQSVDSSGEDVKKGKHKKKNKRKKHCHTQSQMLEEKQNPNSTTDQGYASSSSAWSSDLEDDIKAMNNSGKNDDSEEMSTSKKKKSKSSHSSGSKDKESKRHEKRSRSRERLGMSHSHRRSRSRDRSRERYRSRNRERHRSRDRSRERHRSRDREIYRSRSRDQSRDRYRRSRSKSRSPYRHRRSISKDRNKYSKQSSEHGFRKHSIDLSSISKKIEIKLTTPAAKEEEETDTKPKDKFSLIGEWKPIIKKDQIKEKSKLKELTAFCEQLSKEKDNDDECKIESNDNESDHEEEVVKLQSSAPKVHHPFTMNPLPPLPPMGIIPIVPMNPAQAIQAGMMLQTMGGFSTPALQPGEVTTHFPVSSGQDHRQQEHYIGPGAGSIVKHNVHYQKVDISATLARRLKAQQILNVTPHDVVARQTLQECDSSIKNWSKADLKPGQFTGEKTRNLLKREDLEGGMHVWAKRDFFNHLKPVQGGIGEKLLRQMGWSSGMPLGKRREGFINPIPIDVRSSKKGLSTIDEEISMMRGGNKRRAPPVVDIEGKHPVSALSELCTRKKMALPDFTVIMDHGPAHHKKFLFSVMVNGVKYQAAQPSPNKKNAKAQAATAALTALGLISG